MQGDMLTYTEINCAQMFCGVTGIRQDAGEGAPVVMTGIGGDTEKSVGALLYYGPLLATGDYDFVSLTPRFPGRTITSSGFYGPNTALFDPRIGVGNVRAVGSYKYSESDHPHYDHGMMYLGRPEGAGIWTQIDVPEEVAGAEVANTIPHSVMGDLVVGNYDLVGDPLSAHAFVYNFRTDTYKVLGIGQLTTAYGIWQNYAPHSDPETATYTITGGYDGASQHGLNQGFLLKYLIANGPVLPPAPYSYDNVPGIATHFEGITAVAGGYTLASMSDRGTAFVRIPRSADGSFGEARWTHIEAPFDTHFCTGNTILDNHLLGIYKPDTGGVRTYIATVVESTES